MLLASDSEKLLGCFALKKTELFAADWHVNCIMGAEARDIPECG